MSTPAERRLLKTQEQRARIYGTAIDLFAAKGFEETSVGDIADAVVVSRSTIFNYYPRKQDFLSEWAHGNTRRIRRTLPNDAIAHVGLESSLSSYAKELELLCSAQAVAPTAISAIEDPMRTLAHAWIRRDLTRVVLRSRGSTSMNRQTGERITTILAPVFAGALIRWAGGRDERALRDDLKVSVATVMHGVVLDPVSSAHVARSGWSAA